MPNPSFFSLCPLCLCGKSVLQFQRQAPVQPLQRHGDDDAAAIPEPTAACTPFQRIAAFFPLRNNNNLATTSRVPAAHRRGKNANCAIEVHKP